MRLENKHFSEEEVLEFYENLKGSCMIGRCGNMITFIHTDRIGMAGYCYFTLSRSKDGKIIIGNPKCSISNMFHSKFETMKEAADRFNKYAEKHGLI